MTENDQNVRLTAQQEQAVIALALTNSTAKTAEQVGVSERTVRRWLQREAFSVAYRAQARQNSAQAMAAVQNALLQAVNVLWEQLGDDNPQVRFRSASRLLEAFLQGRGLDLKGQDVEERLAGLERILHEAVK